MPKIIYNNIIPFKGFKALNFFGIIFARQLLNEIDINHELIHTAQMKELLYVFFYIIYLIEWLFKLIYYGFNNKKAYRAISFEKEAYANEKDLDYLNKRCWFAQWEI